MILHLGGNDVGHTKTYNLIDRIKHDLNHLSMSSPNTTIVFSDIIPRLLWLSHPELKKFEKIRNRVNHSVEKCMPLIGGYRFDISILWVVFQACIRRILCISPRWAWTF